MNRLIFSLKLEYNGLSYELSNFNANKPFLSCEYNIEKNASDRVNQSTFSIYNLPTRISQYFSKNENEQKDISIVFSVGNSDDNIISQVFSGKVSTCLSNDDITTVTEISAFPIADVKIYSQISLTKGSTVKDLKTIFAGKLGLLLDNQVDDGEQQIQQDYNVITDDILGTARKKFYNQNILINDNRLVFLKKTDKNTKIKDISHIFTETNGLLKLTPHGEIIEIENFLRPNVSINDCVFLDKRINNGKSYNGTYYVSGLNHSGKISYTESTLNTSVFQLKKSI